jgi:nucleotide-binding universal stress UspA family protein
MIVIAALNGSLTSEASAHYALHYSRVHGFELHLLHVHNTVDSKDAVVQSIAKLETEALRLGVNVKRVFLEGKPIKALQSYVNKMFVDTIFCSTSAARRLFKDSFSEKATRMRLKCDLAVVRIVNLERARNHRSLMLSIRDSRLAVQKFTFFASLAKAYETPAEIYSIKVMRRSALATLDAGLTKKLLREIDNQLVHYRKLAALANFRFRLKHAITTREDASIICGQPLCPRRAKRYPGICNTLRRSYQRHFQLLAGI